MRKIIVFFALFACISVVNSQATFNKAIDLTGTREEIYSIKQPNDTTYLVTGYISVSAANKDAMAALLDTGGNVIWTKQYGGSTHERMYDICKEDSNTFYLAGYTSSYGAGSKDGYVIKINYNGDTLWTKTFGNSESNEFQGIDYTPAGNLIITGTTLISSTQYLYLVKLDTAGNLIWEKTFGSGAIIGYDVFAGYNGYIISGLIEKMVPKVNQAYLFKTDTAGNIKWEKDYGSNYADVAHKAIPTSDSGIAMVGTYQSGPSNFDAYVVKTDSLGNQQWNQIIGGSDLEKGFAIAETHDKGFVITGLRNNGSVNNNLLLAKVNQDGTNVLWNKSYGDNDYENGNAVLETCDTNIVVSGIDDDKLLFYQTNRFGCFEYTPVIVTDTVICDSVPVSMEVNSYNSYLWSNGATTRINSVAGAGSYAVTVTNNNNCPGYSDSVSLVDGTPYFSINYNDTVFCYQNPTTISVDTSTLIAGYSYNFSWSSGDTTLNIEKDSSGIYEITFNNTTLSCQVSKSVEFITPVPAMQSFEMAGYDTATNSQMLYWENNLDDSIVAYNIYRKQFDSIGYELIASSLPYDTNTYSDTDSSIFSPVNYYVITTIDTCGNESAYSKYHKTLQLKVDKLSDSVVFKYHPYEIEDDNLDIIYYDILKGKNLDELFYFKTFYPADSIIIDSDSASAKSLRYYQIVAKLQNHIISSDSSIYIKEIYSNIVAINDPGTGIKDRIFNNMEVGIYPNPFSNEINIDLSLYGSKDVAVYLYNATGQVVDMLYKAKGTATSETISLYPAQNLPNGLYYIRIIAGKEQVMKPVIHVD